MQAIRHRKFTKPLILMSVARDILGEFLGSFGTDLAAAGVVLPDAAMPDAEYCGALSKLMLSPDGLPFALNEVLCAVDEMATPDGRAQLLEAVLKARLGLEIRQESSDLDFAMLVWLRAPTLFVCKHAEFQTTRCCTFTCFGAANPKDRSLTFAPPDAPTVAQMTATIDGWYASRHKGIETTNIEVYPFADDVWFPVRHGDSYVRAMTAERQQRKVIHFRPEKDDIAIYSPALDTLRVTVKTKGEKTLYRESFGYHLFGDSQYFSTAATHTLEPLRVQGQRVLDVDGLKGVERIALIELEVELDQRLHEVKILKGKDLFALAAESGETLFPENCTVKRAVFELRFSGGGKPCQVHICPPHKVRLTRGCDSEIVRRWLLLRKLRVAATGA